MFDGAADSSWESAPSEGLRSAWRLPLERLRPLLLIDRLAPEEEPWIPGNALVGFIEGLLGFIEGLLGFIRVY